VLASNHSSLPEVVADGGVLADPTDLDGFSAALGALLDDPDRRAALARAGLARAGRFTWAATADTTVAVYQRALSRGQRPTSGPVRTERVQAAPPEDRGG
jgi:alpha-1,3-rhamnosyl/mannosyltransferase